jgi:hypothetical protein
MRALAPTEKKSSRGADTSDKLPALDDAKSTRTAREKKKAALEALLALSAEEYVELAFEASSFSIWDSADESPRGTGDAADKAIVAAKGFDERHVRHSKAVRKHLVALEVTPEDLAQRTGYNQQLLQLRRNRFFLRESITHAGGVRSRRRKKPRWKLETSCWSERAKTGNSKDFFETADAMRRMFNTDWSIAAKAHELSWYIVKTQNDPSTWRDLDRSNVSADGEVEEVREALWQHHRLIYGAYDYYSALYSENENALGEPDIFNISFASYMNFCEHNQFTSKRVPPGEFEVIWAVVNAKDKALTSQEDRFNKGSYLNRQEFIQCLVRCAIAVYVKRGTIGDVSDAVNQLCVTNLLQCMEKRCPSALQNSNAFRTRFCYLEATSVVIEQNLASLKTLYESYAEVSRGAADHLRDDALMSIGEWMTFVKQMGLIESRQITALQVRLQLA